jgi:hypothetical protein
VRVHVAHITFFTYADHGCTLGRDLVCMRPGKLLLIQLKWDAGNTHHPTHALHRMQRTLTNMLSERRIFVMCFRDAALSSIRHSCCSAITCMSIDTLAPLLPKSQRALAHAALVVPRLISGGIVLFHPAAPSFSWQAGWAPAFSSTKSFKPDPGDKKMDQHVRPDRDSFSPLPFPVADASAVSLSATSMLRQCAATIQNCQIQKWNDLSGRFICCITFGTSDARDTVRYADKRAVTRCRPHPWQNKRS